ncbi:MAG: hypothetical protein NZR01_03670 [Bryobacteraceae bacterium]|nr:hypothetical protein [Bryobacteraceae bacterium]
MILVRKTLIVSLWLAVLPAFSQEAFRPKPATAYPSHQKVGPLVLAAVKFETDSETKPLFGINPNEYGVLPVLLILENQGAETLMLDRMRVSYQYRGMEVLPTPAHELPSILAPRRPRVGMTTPIPLPKKKNPLARVEFESRAFSAKTLLKGETAHGFLYFETRHRTDAILYITGIREGVSGKELFFAEVPIDSPK